MPGDDFLYSLKFPESGYLGDQKILNIYDFIESQFNHYSNYNYRVIPHFILQLILLLPGWVFDFINTAVFLTFPLVILRTSRKELKFWPYYIFVLLFIWVFHFDLGRAYFWTTGSLNYSWILLLQLSYLSLLFDYARSKTPNPILLIPLTVLISMANENVTLSLFLLSFALVLNIYISKRKLDVPLLISSGILMIGGIMMLISPALDFRLAKEGFHFDGIGYKMIEYFKRTGYYLLRYTPVILVLLFAGQKSVKFNKQGLYLLFAVFLSMTTMIIASLFEARSALFGFMVMLMFAVSLVETDRTKNIYLSILILISFVLGIERVPLFKDLHERSEHNRMILEANVDSRDTVYLNRFCTTSKYECLICDDISDDPEYMDNEPLAAYYNIHKVSLNKDQALYYKWDSFNKLNQIKRDSFFQNHQIVNQKLIEKIKLEKISFNHGVNGLSIVYDFDDSEIADDYIMILRGSRKRLIRYKLLAILPKAIRLYFLDYLEYQGKPIVDENSNYLYNHVFNPEVYEYYISSLYSMNNHSPVGEIITIRANSGAISSIKE